MKPPVYLMRLLQIAIDGSGWRVEIAGPGLIGECVEITLEHQDGAVLRAAWRMVDPWDPTSGWRFEGGNIRLHRDAKTYEVGVRQLLREVQRIGGAS